MHRKFLYSWNNEWEMAFFTGLQIYVVQGYIKRIKLREEEKVLR
jgi:hypothetical protein